MNLLDLLRARGLNPVHVSSAKGGEYASPCPGCGGTDRFHCWPEQEGGPACQDVGARGTYWCRSCGAGGDLLQFLQDFEGMSFTEACSELGADWKAKRPANGRLPQPPRPAVAAFAPANLALPSVTWRERAARLVDRAHEHLLRAPTPLAWLAKRGLDLSAVRRYRLGYLEEEHGKRGIIRPLSAWGLDPVEKQLPDGTKVLKRTFWIPRGITIPAYGPEGPDGLPIRVRIRRPDGDLAGQPGGFGDKYMVVKGSGMAPLLLGGSARAFVVVEAELDAMLVHHLAGDLPRGGVGALAVLTNLGKPDAVAHAVLSRAHAVLVALDYDTAGFNGWAGPDPAKGPRPDGWAGWGRVYRQARRWPTPLGKDPGDMFAAGEDLRLWIMAGLPPVYRLRPGAPAEPAVSAVPAANVGPSPSGALPPQGGGGDQTPANAPEPSGLGTPPSRLPRLTRELHQRLVQLALFMKRHSVSCTSGEWFMADRSENACLDLVALAAPPVDELMAAHPDAVVTHENLLAPYNIQGRTR